MHFRPTKMPFYPFLVLVVWWIYWALWYYIVLSYSINNFVELAPLKKIYQFSQSSGTIKGLHVASLTDLLHPECYKYTLTIFVTQFVKESSSTTEWTFHGNLIENSEKKLCKNLFGNYKFLWEIVYNIILNTGNILLF